MRHCTLQAYLTLDGCHACLAISEDNETEWLVTSYDCVSAQVQAQASARSLTSIGFLLQNVHVLDYAVWGEKSPQLLLCHTDREVAAVQRTVYRVSADPTTLKKWRRRAVGHAHLLVAMTACVARYRRYGLLFLWADELEFVFLLTSKTLCYVRQLKSSLARRCQFVTHLQRILAVQEVLEFDEHDAWWQTQVSGL